ncbi:MAG: insulinase family protein [Deltaproteobacteria bacterium]|nr:insulinase family protein [Deltaproteobacteria bacterium]
MINIFFVFSMIFAMEGVNMNLKFDIETYKLNNGLVVFLLEDHSLPIVAVDVNYNVGSKNEVRGKTGFAHLFEHIMFQGSKHFNDDYFKALQDIGGEVNGATNQDRTRYYEILPSNYLERALWLESDRMGYLLDALSEERLKNQISVVINEYRQNYENRPYGMVYFELLKLLYPPHHPYSWPTIGFPEDISTATLEDVKNFFTTYYSVNNATIAIAGDINKEETKRLVEKYFGSFKPSKPVKYVSKWSPPLTETKRVIMKENVNLPKIYIAFPSTPIFEKYDAEMDIIAKVLGENENSRLYKKLVKERKLASDVSAYQSSGQIAGYLLITVTLFKDKDIEEARELILKEIDKIINTGITNKELQQAKSYFKSDFIRSLKRLGGFGGITDRMNFYYQMLGNPNMFEYDLNRYINATLSSVKTAAKKYLNQNYAEIIVLPEKNYVHSKEDLDRSKMPQGNEEKPVNFPVAKITNTQKGFKLLTMPYSRLPLSHLSIIIPAGSSLDGDKKGLANFTANMMLTGTKDLTNEEIQSRLDLLGSTINIQVDQDSIIILSTFLNEKAEETIKLLKEILFEPSFDEKEIDIQRGRFINSLKTLSDQPNFIANVILARHYFKDHPYGHLPIGEMNFYTSVKRENLIEFYKNNILASNPIFTYTGSLHENTIKEYIDSYLSSFTPPRKNSKLIQKRITQHGLRVLFSPRPGSTQSYIVVAFKGIMRKDDEVESAIITNTIFGGYFISRLNMRLREEKGFTYGVRSNLRFYLHDSLWLITTSVQADATIPTIKEIISVMKEMKRDELLSEEEVTRAKGYMTNRFPIEFETIDNLHSKLTNIALFDLPNDVINIEHKKLKETSKGKVKSIINQYFNEENIMIVVVGEPKIYTQLKEVYNNAIEVLLTPDEGKK